MLLLYVYGLFLFLRQPTDIWIPEYTYTYIRESINKGPTKGHSRLFRRWILYLYFTFASTVYSITNDLGTMSPTPATSPTPTPSPTHRNTNVSNGLCGDKNIYLCHPGIIVAVIASIVIGSSAIIYVFVSIKNYKVSKRIPVIHAHPRYRKAASMCSITPKLMNASTRFVGRLARRIGLEAPNIPEVQSVSIFATSTQRQRQSHRRLCECGYRDGAD